jgi:hypothetical protein
MINNEVRLPYYIAEAVDGKRKSDPVRQLATSLLDLWAEPAVRYMLVTAQRD